MSYSTQMRCRSLARSSVRSLATMRSSRLRGPTGNERNSSSRCTWKSSISFILEWLEQHYAGPISVESLAKLVDVSPRTLHRSFKKTLGMSPMNYVIDLRLRKAEEMLCGPGARVKEVAASVGIPDASYFSRLFRKRTGHEPSAYRAEHLQSVMKRAG